MMTLIDDDIKQIKATLEWAGFPSVPRPDKDHGETNPLRFSDGKYEVHVGGRLVSFYHLEEIQDFHLDSTTVPAIIDMIVGYALAAGRVYQMPSGDWALTSNGIKSLASSVARIS